LETIQPMKAFTLIELLVVMTIISILTSLLLGSVSKARVQAQKVACRVAVRSYVLSFSEQGRLVIDIPREANCHQCHRPRYNAGPFLDEASGP
jgi:prepilin-type N-terminal cleavage/methylation domain-containing protein